MKLIHQYNNLAGRSCALWQVDYNQARPWEVACSVGGKTIVTYWVSDTEAEHAAAHYMATGQMPEASGKGGEA